jgi:hypothetical protein
VPNGLVVGSDEAAAEPTLCLNLERASAEASPDD